jgi:hypothetical protein
MAVNVVCLQSRVRPLLSSIYRLNKQSVLRMIASSNISSSDTTSSNRQVRNFTDSLSMHTNRINFGHAAPSLKLENICEL